jgi:hypothetical protein
MRTRRKLYYPVGLLSLALLPMLCMGTLNSHHVFDDLRVLDVTWPPKLEDIDSSLYPIYRLPNRIYIDINLTGDTEEDNIKLDFAQLEIRSMKATHDTIKGVRFHFNNEAKYSSFVRAINICKIENADRYIADGNNIWVLNTISEQDAKSGIPFWGSCIVYDMPKAKTTDDINARSIIDISPTYLPSIIIFVIMILLTIKQVYNLSKP